MSHPGWTTARWHRHLRMLRDEDEPLVYLMEGDRGLFADLYEPRIPDSSGTRASALEWRAGKVRGLRPVCRDFGLAAAFVDEAVDHVKGRLTSFDLAREGRRSLGGVDMIAELARPPSRARPTPAGTTGAPTAGTGHTAAGSRTGPRVRGKALDILERILGAQHIA